MLFLGLHFYTLSKTCSPSVLCVFPQAFTFLMVSIKTYFLLTLDLSFVSDLSPLSHPESCPTMPQKLFLCWYLIALCFIINTLLLLHPFILRPLLWMLFALKTSGILHSCFLCPHCCPPRWLILCYYLSCFSFIPHSTSVDQLSLHPVYHFFMEQTLCPARPNIIVWKLWSRKSAIICDTIRSNGCSQFLFALCMSWSPARREENHSQSSIPFCFPFRTSVWLLLGRRLFLF